MQDRPEKTMAAMAVVRDTRELTDKWIIRLGGLKR
jgi:hypothetical protein